MATSSSRKLKELSSAFNVSAGGIIVPSGASRRRPRSSASGGIGASYASGAPVRLPVAEEPLRAIDGNLYLSRSLLEISQWSIEAAQAVTTISRDAFGTADGDIGSWAIAGVRDGPDDEDRQAIDENTKAVVRDLQQRRCGKTYVVGGMRFQQAINEMLRFGDSFVQLRFAKEGLSSSPSDWCVAETFYMPTFATFVLQDDVGREAGYRRMFAANDECEDYGLLEILHFCHQANGLYGTTPFSAMLPTWDMLKRVYPAVESAVVDTGAAPWVHTMPPGASEEQRQAYEDTHSELAAEGVVKNLYLMDGAEVRKAINNDAGTRELIDTWLELRRSMIPFGLPSYFFSLPSRAGAQDLNLQPAMLYARLIAFVRSLVGEQIKWICDIEIALKLGVDHLHEHPYDIIWPRWEVSPPQRVEVGREADS